MWRREQVGKEYKSRAQQISFLEESGSNLGEIVNEGLDLTDLQGLPRNLQSIHPALYNTAKDVNIYLTEKKYDLALNALEWYHQNFGNLPLDALGSANVPGAYKVDESAIEELHTGLLTLYEKLSKAYKPQAVMKKDN